MNVERKILVVNGAIGRITKGLKENEEVLTVRYAVHSLQNQKN